MYGLEEEEVSCVEAHFRTQYAKDCIAARNIYKYLKPLSATMTELGDIPQPFCGTGED